MSACRLLLFVLLTLRAAAPSHAAMTAESVMILEEGLQQPSAVAVAEDGRAFVLDGLQRRIQVFDNAGKLVHGVMLPAGEMPATDIAYDKGLLYVADPSAQRILVLTPQGKLLKELRPRPDEQPVEPSSVLVLGNQLWWSDRRGHRLCRSRLNGEQPVHCQGGRGEALGRFRYPYMLAADTSGYVLAVDVLNARVQIHEPGGKPVGSLGGFGMLPGYLFRPNGLVVWKNGGVLVSDAWTGHLTLFYRRKAQGLLVHDDGRPWRFSMPVGMALWKDRLYVADLLANRVEVLRLKDNPGLNTSLPEAKPERDSRKNCLQCHPSWSRNYQPEENTLVLPVADRRMCLSCHHGAVMESRPLIAHGHQHPTLHDQREGKPAGDTTRFDNDEVPRDFPLKKNGHLDCASCHTPHKPPKEAVAQGRRNPWLRKPNRNSSLCLECHASRHTGAEDRQRKGLKVLNHPLGVMMKKPVVDKVQGYARREELQQGLPDALKQAGARLGDRGQLICQSCHQVHGAKGKALLVMENDQGALCISCHRSQNAKDRPDAHDKGIHPVGVKTDKEVELGGRKIHRLDCLACHSVHDAQPGTALLPRGENARDLCANCHERQNAADKEEAFKKGVHPVNTLLDEPVKLAGQEIRNLDCRGCHSVHEGVEGTAVLVENDADGKLCASCHEKQEKLSHTDHDLRRHPGEYKNRLNESWNKEGLCGACHSMHRGEGKQPFLFVGPPFQPEENQDMTARDALCMGCHHKDNDLEAKPIEHFTHPWKDLILRSDPNDMPLLDQEGKVSEFGRIACITCHEPHRWRPQEESPLAGSSKDGDNEEGTVLSSFLRRKGAGNSFCVTCHGREAKVRYLYYHDDRGRQ